MATEARAATATPQPTITTLSTNAARTPSGSTNAASTAAITSQTPAGLATATASLC